MWLCWVLPGYCVGAGGADKRQHHVKRFSWLDIAACHPRDTRLAHAAH